MTKARVPKPTAPSAPSAREARVSAHRVRGVTVNIGSVDRVVSLKHLPLEPRERAWQKG